MAANPQPNPHSDANQARGYLSLEELKRLRRQLIEENLSHDPPSPDGRRAWDSADGRKITCLLCGRQLSDLGERGGKNHLFDEHQMTAREYSVHCKQQGWGDAPVLSLKTRKLSAKWRDEHREEIKVLNQKGRSRRNEYRKKHLRQEAAAQLARKQKKLLATLTPEQKAAMVPCPLCERDGHPEYRFKNLYSSHVTRYHKMRWKQFKKEFQNARVGTEDEKKRQGVQVEKMRAKLLAFPPREKTGRLGGKRRGRTPGMEIATQKEAIALVRYIQEFVQSQGTKKGSVVFAATRVYPHIDSRKAVARAEKTLSKYRNMTGTKVLA